MCKKEKRGGARPGSGRKKLDKSMLHTNVDNSFLAKLRAAAKNENLTVGDWLFKHVKL